MASTNFQDYNQNTPIVSAWLNDVNGVAYTATGKLKNSLQSAAAWVRFSVTDGVVAIQQSSNISTVTRTSAGLYVITYGSAMAGVANAYTITTNLAGFQTIFTETANSVTVETTNTSNVATDPTVVCVMVFGAN